MSEDFPPPTSESSVIVVDDQFVQWESLNDTIMGGSSMVLCRATSEGLLMEGQIVQENGGFVSCRSPIFSPPLNLSKYKGFQLDILGDGRTYKFALGCINKIFGLPNLFSSGLRWVAEVPTRPSGITSIDIPFSKFEPTIRAKAVAFPVSLDPSSITQLQLLHSKFGQPGELNKGFRTGKIKIYLRSIRAFS